MKSNNKYWGKGHGELEEAYVEFTYLANDAKEREDNDSFLRYDRERSLIRDAMAAYERGLRESLEAFERGGNE